VSANLQNKQNLRRDEIHLRLAVARLRRDEIHQLKNS